MQCVILAGGLGTRLLPITEQIPKSLVEVAGVPFASHQLAWLAGQGVTEVVYSIGHLGHLIREFVGDGRSWGVKVSYADEGRELKGTGGALRLALNAALLDDSFFVLYGDSFLPIEMPPVWRASSDRRRPLLTVFRNDGRWDSSNVRFVDGKVELYEKDRADAAEAGMRHIDYGLSILSRGVIEEFVPADGVVDLSSVFTRLSLAARLDGFEVHERFYEIGSRQGLIDLEAYLLRRPGVVR